MSVHGPKPNSVQAIEMSAVEGGADDGQHRRSPPLV